MGRAVAFPNFQTKNKTMSKQFRINGAYCSFTIIDKNNFIFTIESILYNTKINSTFTKESFLYFVDYFKILDIYDKHIIYPSYIEDDGGVTQFQEDTIDVYDYIQNYIGASTITEISQVIINRMYSSINL